jgi:ABC-2 type transport system ATP-binding protein
MLQIEKIKKRFGDREVVRGVSFSVNRGEAFGLLGPNGAGKSTTISMICGLIPIDHGDVMVDGYSVKRNPRDVKQRIGIVPQDIALYPTMSAQENLMFWGRMYGLSGNSLKKRTRDVLEIVGLSDRAKDAVGSFSGGMKRRINIGAALLHQPQLLIMDEPTVGIDPQSRNHILETVRTLNQSGMTVMYTSHYMEEVDFLCNRIAIIDHGEVITLGTKHELCSRLAGGTAIEIKVDIINDVAIQALKQMTAVQSVAVNKETFVITVYAEDTRSMIGEIITLLVSKGIQVLSLDVTEANLEAVFLQLTGRTLRD